MLSSVFLRIALFVTASCNVIGLKATVSGHVLLNKDDKTKEKQEIDHSLLL